MAIGVMLLSLLTGWKLVLSLRSRRLLKRAIRAYEAEQWIACLRHYRDYLRLARRTLGTAGRDEILRRMAFAIGEGDLRADLWSVKREFQQLELLAPRLKSDAAARREYAAAQTRLKNALQRLDFSPAGAGLAEDAEETEEDQPSVN